MANDQPTTVHPTKQLPLLMTTGEPAGIGMDIVLQLASQGKLATLNRPIIVLADNEALQQRCQMMFNPLAHGKHKLPTWQVIGEVATLYSSCNANTAHTGHNIATQFTRMLAGDADCRGADFLVIHTPVAMQVRAGQLTTHNAPMVMTQLQLAHDLASAGCIAAIVTGPLQKSVLIDAGLTLKDGTLFTGHTEFFMQQTGCAKVVMMLANSAMRVALVTTHLPLREVADAITADNVRQTVHIVLDALKQKFSIPQPKILVCGLNPHAGEGGHLGLEEIDIINPVLQEFRLRGIDVPDAMPADTLFTKRHLANCDAVVAMFHDQGLPVLKSHGFGDTVNLTLGLPYIRTSVDHGTALDLAGHCLGGGEASASSLWQALTMANAMASSVAMPLTVLH